MKRRLEDFEMNDITRYANASSDQECKAILAEIYRKQHDTYSTPLEQVCYLFDMLENCSGTLVSIFLANGYDKVLLERIAGIDQFFCIEIIAEQINEHILNGDLAQLNPESRQLVEHVAMLAAALKNAHSHEPAYVYLFPLLVVSLLFTQNVCNAVKQIGNLPPSFLCWCRNRQFPLRLETQTTQDSLTNAIRNFASWLPKRV